MCKAVIFFFIAALGLGFLLAAPNTGVRISPFPEEILIQSMESKTEKGQSVFNAIKWIRLSDKEIWMMNQSHHGLGAVPALWDRLAIVLETKNGNKTARFLQLPPGKLEWSEDLPQQKIKNRASCFMCHSNGPRAIRSEKGPIINTWSQKIQIALWNLRIRSYGRILPDPQHAIEDGDALEKHLTEKVPFRWPGRLENETLQVGACTHCHKEVGLGARGLLTRQNAISIQFMMEKGFMPPVGFSVSNEDERQIKRFIEGF